VLNGKKITELGYRCATTVSFKVKYVVVYVEEKVRK
jgi:hypothetical protein